MGKAFTSSVMRIEPQWIDYNGHMNMAFYHTIFDRATHEAFGKVGLGVGYREARNASFFIVDTHARYLHEVGLDAPVRVQVSLVDYSAKSIHLFSEMIHAEQGFTAATAESLFVHVDLTVRKVLPWPEDVLAGFEAWAQSQGGLLRPEGVGKVVGERG